MRPLLTIAIAFLFLISSHLQAQQLSVPSFFSDHMVLQQKCNVKIWGKAKAGTEVIVQFGQASDHVKADEAGNWSIKIATGNAEDTGRSLSIASGGETLEIDDVLVGEVWLASGQSNMVWTLAKTADADAAISKADYPSIRMFNAPTVTAADPQEDIDGNWTLCSPQTAGDYSGVAYYFARKLHAELNVPIGIIKTAWGGKPIETFISRRALKSLPQTKQLVDVLMANETGYEETTSQAFFEKREAEHKIVLRDWMASGRKGNRPRAPRPPKRPLLSEGNPGVLFNSMIYPFVGYEIQGAIWYQGESNARVGRVPYDTTLSLLIRDWRDRWGNNFAFNFVQLANFRAASQEPGNNDPWPLLQDRMRHVLELEPNTGMAVINDVGDETNIHPGDKRSPGERLARWALAKTYGQDIIHSGPLYQSHTVNGENITITFAAVGDGLRARQQTESLKRFEIAGKDKVWKWANAEILGTNQVILSNTEIANPVAARYAWASNPADANLVNSEGLPTSVFRTDDWDDVVDSTAHEAEQKMATFRATGAAIRSLRNQTKSIKREDDQWQKLNGQLKTKMQEYKRLREELQN